MARGQPHSPRTRPQDEACRCLTLVGSNLCGLLQDLSRPPDCLSAPGLQCDVERLEGEAESLGRNLEGLLSGWAQQAEGTALLPPHE